MWMTTYVYGVRPRACRSRKNARCDINCRFLATFAPREFGQHYIHECVKFRPMRIVDAFGGKVIR